MSLPKLLQPLGSRASAIITVAMVGFLSLLPLRPPSSLDELDGASFSTDRAWRHVEALAAEPRAIGSPAHAAARRYVVDYLESLGLEPRVDPVVVFEVSRDDRVRGARAQNVLARIPAVRDPSSGALLLATHYDSVAASPGAGDAAAGVAAVLETARALVTGPGPAMDVILLITDGEEPGYFGARGFVRDHPWADQVSAVLNLEARGSRGPSIMFEIGPGSMALVDAFGRVSRRPVAFSFSEEVYRYMPNDTDFTVFREAGMPGLNFAFIHGPHHYHTSLDRIGHLNRRSLHHHGVQILALAREVTAELPAVQAPRTWFPLPGVGLTIYASPVWATLLAVVIGMGVLLLAGSEVLVPALKRLWIPVLSFLAAAVLLIAVHWAVFGLAGTSSWQLGDGTLYLTALGLLGFAAGSAAVVWLLRREPLSVQFALTAMCWLSLAGLAAAPAPGAAYLALWPGLVAAGCTAWMSRREQGEPPAPWVGLIGASPVLLLWLPALCLSAVALWVLSAPLPAALAGLVGILLAPCLRALTGKRGAVVASALAGGIAVLLLVWAMAAAGPSRELPRPDSLLYALDGDQGTAVWATFDRNPDEWNGAYVPATAEFRSVAEFFGPGMLEARTAPAPVLALPPPQVRTVDETRRPDGGRTLDLAVSSPRGAAMVRVGLSSPSPFRLDGADGRTLGVAAPVTADGIHFVDLIYYGFPVEGFPLRVVLEDEGNLLVTAVDRSFELPLAALPELQPRPPGIAPTSFVPSDLTLVRREVSL